MKIRTVNCPFGKFFAHHTVLVLVCGLCMALYGTSGIAQAQNPVPLINLPLVPDAIAPGGSGITLTVNGTGFVSGSVVHWNGSPLATTLVSGSQLTATVPASALATPGTASVTVVSPSGGGGTSNVVFFPIAVSTPGVTMDDGTNHAVGVAPVAVSTADLNGDGNLDLVATNSSDNTISVLLGKGDGTFRTQVTYAVGGNPRDIAIADFNGDGKLDLAVTNTNSNTVSILLGNGDGTFQPQMQYGTGAGAYGIAAADLNRDGKLDLVVTNSGSNTISVLLGNGDGTFQAAVNYPAGADPVSVAVGDFSRDGMLDLAVADSDYDSSGVTVLYGNGDGTFSEPILYSTGPEPQSVAAADFNGDGKLDLATANWGGDTISILLGNGDGTFQPQVAYATGFGLPTFVGAADFNGDGKLDLTTADYAPDGFSASILLGNGDGTFQGDKGYWDGNTSAQLAIGDFNGDGKLDLAAADQSTNEVSVLLQTTTITLLPNVLTFGDQVVGVASAAQTLTLTNTGVLTLDISRIAASGSFSQTNTCGSTLKAGANCTISVTFTPTRVGPQTAAVKITDNGTGSPQSVTLSGTGVTSGPNATVSPAGLTFGTRLLNTMSAAKSITLTNYGTDTLTITGSSTQGDFGRTSDCGPTLAPNASCKLGVTFTPEAIGNLSGSLTIADNAPGSPHMVSLAGVGTEVKLNPSSLSFHTCTSEQEQTTLTNVGSSSLSINGITLTGSADFTETNNCGNSVGSVASCTITVTFTYNGGGMSFTGDASISDNGGASPQQLSLGSRCGP